MTDTLLTAQTNTDAGTGSESATDATEQTTDAQGASGGEQQSQSTAETDGKEATASDEQGENATESEDQKDDEGPQYHGAPESYDDFAIPEGVTADEAGLDSFKELAKELDLSQDGAQKLIEFEAARQGRFAEQMLDAHRQQLEQWVNETKQDKEIGGTNFEQATATARKAFGQFGDDDFSKLMAPFDPEKNPTGLGLGNHPAVVRVFNRIGKAISEDQPGEGDSQGGSSEEARLSKRYPNTQA